VKAGGMDSHSRSWNDPTGLGWQLWRRTQSTGLLIQHIQRQLARLRIGSLSARHSLGSEIRDRWGLGGRGVWLGRDLPVLWGHFRGLAPSQWRHDPMAEAARRPTDTGRHVTDSLPVSSVHVIARSPDAVTGASEWADHVDDVGRPSWLGRMPVSHASRWPAESAPERPTLSRPTTLPRSTTLSQPATLAPPTTLARSTTLPQSMAPPRTTEILAVSAGRPFGQRREVAPESVGHAAGMPGAAQPMVLMPDRGDGSRVSVTDSGAARAKHPSGSIDRASSGAIRSPAVLSTLVGRAALSPPAPAIVVHRDPMNRGTTWVGRAVADLQMPPTALVGLVGIRPSIAGVRSGQVTGSFNYRAGTEHEAHSEAQGSLTAAGSDLGDAPGDVSSRDVPPPVRPGPSEPPHIARAVFATPEPGMTGAERAAAGRLPARLVPRSRATFPPTWTGQTGVGVRHGEEYAPGEGDLDQVSAATVLTRKRMAVSRVARSASRFPGPDRAVPAGPRRGCPRDRVEASYRWLSRDWSARARSGQGPRECLAPSTYIVRVGSAGLQQPPVWAGSTTTERPATPVRESTPLLDPWDRPPTSPCLPAGRRATSIAPRRPATLCGPWMPLKLAR
jgi:hypothetical protein